MRERETKLTALVLLFLPPRNKRWGGRGCQKQEDGGHIADSHSLSRCVEGRAR